MVKQTVIREHKDDCWAVKEYGGDWVIEDTVWQKRDVLHRLRKTVNDRRFLRFRCNDASCMAQMIVLASDVHKACQIEGRSGKPQ